MIVVSLFVSILPTSANQVISDRDQALCQLFFEWKGEKDVSENSYCLAMQ